MINKEQFLLEYLHLGEAKWEERELGIQLIALTTEQRKSHLATLAQRDLIRNIEEDKNIV